MSCGPDDQLPQELPPTPQELLVIEQAEAAGIRVLLPGLVRGVSVGVGPETDGVDVVVDARPPPHYDPQQRRHNRAPTSQGTQVALMTTSSGDAASGPDGQAAVDQLGRSVMRPKPKEGEKLLLTSDRALAKTPLPVGNSCDAIALRAKQRRQMSALADITADLAASAMLEERTPMLLQRLKREARTIAERYDTSHLTRTELTHELTKCVGAAMIMTPAEMEVRQLLKDETTSRGLAKASATAVGDLGTRGFFGTLFRQSVRLPPAGK